MDLFEMKTSKLNLGQSLKDANEKLAEMAGQPDVSAEDIKAQQNKVDGLQLRFKTISDQVEKDENEQKANLTNVKNKQAENKISSDPKERMIQMEAAWIRKTVRPDNAEFQEKWNEIKQEMKADTD